MTHGCVEGDPPYLRPQPHIMASEANRERTHARASSEAAPRTHVSFHMRLSRDFSRRRRMESLLAGKRQTVRVVSPLRVRQTNSFLQDEACNFRSLPRWLEHLIICKDQGKAGSFDPVNLSSWYLFLQEPRYRSNLIL